MFTCLRLHAEFSSLLLGRTGNTKCVDESAFHLLCRKGSKSKLEMLCFISVLIAFRGSIQIDSLKNVLEVFLTSILPVLFTSGKAKTLFYFLPLLYIYIYTLLGRITQPHWRKHAKQKIFTAPTSENKRLMYVTIVLSQSIVLLLFLPFFFDVHDFLFSFMQIS